MHGIKVDLYSAVVDSMKWKQFFLGSHFLTWDGLQSLINAFISWSGPQIAEMEQLITGLVSKGTFGEFFKRIEENEEEK